MNVLQSSAVTDAADSKLELGTPVEKENSQPLFITFLNFSVLVKRSSRFFLTTSIIHQSQTWRKLIRLLETRENIVFTF